MRTWYLNYFPQNLLFSAKVSSESFVKHFFTEYVPWLQFHLQCFFQDANPAEIGSCHITVIVIKLWWTTFFFNGNYIIKLYESYLQVFLTKIEVKSIGLFLSFCRLTYNLILLSIHHKISRIVVHLMDSCRVWAISMTETPIL